MAVRARSTCGSGAREPEPVHSVFERKPAPDLIHGQGGDDDTSMQILRERPDQAGKIFPERGVQPDQQRKHRNAQDIGRHARSGIRDFLGKRLIPDVAETQEIGPAGVGHPALQVADEY